MPNPDELNRFSLSVGTTDRSVSPTEQLTDAAKAYASAALSPNTRRAYAAQLRLWQDHAAQQSLPVMPADPTAVANWLAARAGAGQALSTIRTAVAAIRATHHAAGHPFDAQHPALAHVMKGIARSSRREQDQAEPLTAAMVLDIIARPASTLIDRRDAALIAVGYVFALRRSELVGLDLGRLGAGNGYIEITDATLRLRLLRSKTGTLGSPEDVVVPRQHNSEAVRAIEAWIRAGSVVTGAPLFPSIKKGEKLTPERLTEQSVNLIIQKQIIALLRRRAPLRDLASIEAEASKYSGHSLRVGFAVTAANSGADLRSIATVTRHKSLEMPRRYAKSAELLRTSPHKLLGVGLHRG